MGQGQSMTVWRSWEWRLPSEPEVGCNCRWLMLGVDFCSATAVCLLSWHLDCCCCFCFCCRCYWCCGHCDSNGCWVQHSSASSSVVSALDEEARQAALAAARREVVSFATHAHARTHARGHTRAHVHANIRTHTYTYRDTQHARNTRVCIWQTNIDTRTLRRARAYTVAHNQSTCTHADAPALCDAPRMRTCVLECALCARPVHT